MEADACLDALCLVSQERHHGQLAAANDLQAAKVRALMKTIDALQKESARMKRGATEHRRTDQFRQMQVELGRQDGIIEALRQRIGEARAQELVADLAAAADDADLGDEVDLAACSVCGAPPLKAGQLFRGVDGVVCCRACYSQRHWGPPSPRRKVTICPERPESREDLLAELEAAKREEVATERRLQRARDTAEEAKRPRSAAHAGLSSAAERETEHSVEALRAALASLCRREQQLEQEGRALEAACAGLARAAEEQRERTLVLQQQWGPAAAAHAEGVVARGPKAIELDFAGQAQIKQAQIARAQADFDWISSRLDVAQRQHEKTCQEHEVLEEEVANARTAAKKAGQANAGPQAEMLAAETRKTEAIAQEADGPRRQLREAETKWGEELRRFEHERRTLENDSAGNETKEHEAAQESAVKSFEAMLSRWKADMEVKLASIGAEDEAEASISAKLGVAIAEEGDAVAEVRAAASKCNEERKQHAQLRQVREEGAKRYAEEEIAGRLALEAGEDRCAELRRANQEAEAELENLRQKMVQREQAALQERETMAARAKSEHDNAELMAASAEALEAEVKQARAAASSKVAECNIELAELQEERRREESEADRLEAWVVVEGEVEQAAQQRRRASDLEELHFDLAHDVAELRRTLAEERLQLCRQLCDGCAAARDAG